MELRIREFQKQDMDALYFLDQGCYPEEQRSPYNTLLETLLDKDCAALVAEEIGEGYAKVIGALIVQGDPRNSKLYVISLMVNEEFRGLGIGGRLLDWAERLAHGFKCDALLMRLPENDADGEAFLSANGFTVSEGEVAQNPDGEAGAEEDAQESDGEPDGQGSQVEAAQMPDDGQGSRVEEAQNPDGGAGPEVEVEAAERPEGEADMEEEGAPNPLGGTGVLWMREVGDEAAT